MAAELSLFELLKLTFDRKGSDLHLKVGLPPAMRIDGEVQHLDVKRFSRPEFEKILDAILSSEQQKQFHETNELDFSHALEGICRFRVNLYRDINGIGAVFRVIPYRVFTFQEIGLPPAAQKLIEQPNGLILVTGPTGAGKTSTLASFISFVNANARRHIVTLEDPIEYEFEDQLSIINQRQIGGDCPSFEQGLLTVLRQDPDIVVVGEMRDPRTIALTLNAAETGKLVLATLHTTSAVMTAERIVNVFPENQQRQILHQLSTVLRGVVSQTLLPRTDGGRIAAFEVLINTSAVRTVISEGKIHILQSFVEAGSEYGMVTLESSLFQLVRVGYVRAEEALAMAPNPVNFKKLLSGLREP